jgi:hypothetical protein
VAADFEAASNAALRMTATGQHPDAARLRHAQQIDYSNDS